MDRHVLWAEDNACDRALIEAALEDLPTKPRVQFVGDGPSVLQALPHGKPSLVVLDIAMPYMDGIRTLAEIRRRKEWTDVPVVIFSDDPGTRHSECRRLGIRNFVSKPTQLDAFTQAVHSIVAV